MADLSFTMQPQQQTQWCWSAVSTSTSLFYNAASTWTQCKLANSELGQTTCCQNGGSAACNIPWYLDSALIRTNNLNYWAGGASTYTTVEQQVNSSRPHGVRIGWSGGGGHFVIISGYTTGQVLTIRDPWYGTSYITYNTLKTAYQGSGSWTHSYFTKP